MREEKNAISATPNIAWTSESRTIVREELKRILDHPTFNTSHRCVELLGSVVERVLDGGECDIKERTLGVEVFGRETNYDSNADPIVRRVANDVRKRLAQYYQEEPEGHAVIIHLLRGGYLPEFEFLPDAGQKPSAAQNPDSGGSASADRRLEASSFLLSRFCDKRVLALAALVLLVAAYTLLWRSNAFLSPLERVWKPVLDTKGAILVCLPDNAQSHGKQIQLIKEAPPVKAEGPEQEAPAMASAVFQDLRAGNSVITLMTRRNKRVELVSSSAIRYQDFQRGPVILIGGVNNPWVQALLSKLRYTVHFDPAARQSWVQDALAPSNRKWSVGGPFGAAAPPTEDYAVLTRFFSEETGQWIVALSGCSFVSTQAAGELITDPEIAKKISSSVRSRGNFQIVLRTTLMGKEPGPIQMEAFYGW